MKTIKNITKLQILPGKATPAPPIGSSLGQQGINIMTFCKNFNNETKSFNSHLKVRVIITIYSDKTFDFIVKQPTVASLIKKSIKLEKGNSSPGKTDSVAKITDQEIKEIAKLKLKDMNVYNISTAIKVIKGTARSMGIETE